MNELSGSIFKFLKNNEALSISGIELQAGIPKGSLQKAIGGYQKLSDGNLQKLITVLKRYGYQDEGGAKIMAIANNKGGVAKTASTVNISSALRNLGYKVLLVDMDPQGSASRHFGLYELEGQIADAMRDGHDYKIGELLYKIDDLLYLAPSNLNLESILPELQSDDVEGNQRLSKVFNHLRPHFDFILIDCPPSLNILTVNCLMASHSVLIPVQPEPHSIDGLSNIVRLIKKVSSVNPHLKVEGFFFTLVKNTKLHEGLMSTLEEEYPMIKIFEQKIRQNVAVAEACYEGMDVITYDKNSNGAQDYVALTNELING
ncbi:AAA family ATPase [Persicobacter diffluens]|uniref:Sporulation initiation inhibitor Soj n=1 Tax=Persicobacter diffluens TaxID=981 RepID=A0AAN4W2V5_9BACT|nr:sporulation initiation inhibitor Soj [Persicobacter diffluens]GJM64778.1 sporulation initiation inhibitor Soj [Persicobacter diffluens]